MVNPSVLASSIFPNVSLMFCNSDIETIHCVNTTPTVYTLLLGYGYYGMAISTIQWTSYIYIHLIPLPLAPTSYIVQSNDPTPDPRHHAVGADHRSVADDAGTASG